MSLEVKNISFAYKKNIPIFKNVSFKVESGKVLSLLGPNGSGKTTLLKCLNRIHKPFEGEVIVNNMNMKHVNMKKLASYMGYVPQEIKSSLSLSVIDAIFLGRTPYINFKMGRRDEEIVVDILSLLNLKSLAFRMLNELSGGERQRVYLARALVQEPQVLLLDEPTSNLDMRHQIETLEIVKKVAEERNLTVIMAIHDLNMAARYSDRAILMKEGKVFVEGDFKEVITSKTLRQVYHVETIVNYQGEIPFVIPVSVSKQD